MRGGGWRREEGGEAGKRAARRRNGVSGRRAWRSSEGQNRFPNRFRNRFANRVWDKPLSSWNRFPYDTGARFPVSGSIKGFHAFIVFNFSTLPPPLFPQGKRTVYKRQSVQNRMKVNGKLLILEGVPESLPTSPNNSQVRTARHFSCVSTSFAQLVPKSVGTRKPFWGKRVGVLG